MRHSAMISIVDDDADVRFALQNFLRSAGMHVCTFDSAETFLNSPERAETDCLITDLHMPGMDGVAFQEELNRAGRSFPVIVMTAYPTGDAQDRSASLGASAFLAKPVDPELLLEHLENTLTGSN